MKDLKSIQKTAHKDKKSYNTQVYELICKRLNLKRREKILLFKFIGFLLRNHKPFSYSIEKLETNSGYKKSSIFESINYLEKLGIIERVGFTSRVKYTKGCKLIKYCTLVQNRINNKLYIKNSLLQKMDKIIPATPENGYKKTSLSLKHKEKDVACANKTQNPSVTDFQEFHHGVKGYEWVGEWINKQTI